MVFYAFVWGIAGGCLSTVSGVSVDEVRKSALECGMNGFLSKPINLKEVLRMPQTVFHGG